MLTKIGKVISALLMLTIMGITAVPIFTLNEEVTNVTGAEFQVMLENGTFGFYGNDEKTIWQAQHIAREKLCSNICYERADSN